MRICWCHQMSSDVDVLQRLLRQEEDNDREIEYSSLEKNLLQDAYTLRKEVVFSSKPSNPSSNQMDERHRYSLRFPKIDQTSAFVADRPPTNRRRLANLSQ